MKVAYKPLVMRYFISIYMSYSVYPFIFKSDYQ